MFSNIISVRADETGLNNFRVLHAIDRAVSTILKYASVVNYFSVQGCLRAIDRMVPDITIDMTAHPPLTE